MRKAIISRLTFFPIIALLMVGVAVIMPSMNCMAEEISQDDASVSENLNVDAIRQMERDGFSIDGDSLYDRNGTEVMQRSTEAASSGSCSGTSPDGSLASDAADLSLDSDQERTISAEGCSWWWVHGSHRWSYNNYILYTYAKFTAESHTTYGTSTGTCGTPLVVDTLSFNAKVGRDSWSHFSWSKTGHNTSKIEETRKAHGFNIGNPCGMRVTHEASKNGVTWHSDSKSGCYK